MKSFFLFILAIVFFSCQSNNNKEIADPDAKPSDNELSCIHGVLEKDGQWGKVRNHMCENVSLSETIQVYVDSLSQLNFKDCPEQFAAAFKQHIQAWKEMISVTDDFSNLRGEMHDIFNEIEKSENAGDFKIRLKQIWDTWYPVEAWQKDAEMFAAIGGKERWANLKTLYIKATHEEPQLDTSYVSEIWRAIDHFKIRIEQQNKDFHNLGVFSDEGGWVNYVHKDSTRKLSDESLEGWKIDHGKNIYVVLNRLAKSDHYTVGIDSLGRLEYYLNDERICAFNLDDLHRPAEYFTFNMDGSENVSNFKNWENTKGYVHTVGGGPKDGSFTYETEIWTPSEKPFEELYDFEFNFDSLMK